ncbi:MAG TPA: prenyltransferase/squalene oxidase repeat-containing protein [Solirubrobacterales bacterium]|nr:prenyltransferase/squalene oxidase repeat-containing protein [Solirubrobacterales bacterium]
MSWHLAAFLILAGVLIAGFAWYERSRPPSQVVALVAALAALAIAGRIAFAAFPNVKPTTDIVVFAGYALGGAPGFAVGALTALVSNFWFGQGPWTPWQMAGWGLCGVLGAALALGLRDASRLALASTCGFAAIFYGALLNFSLMATYGGDLSWRRFWLLEGRAIPFEVAHFAGNVVLALVAGPAMVRMLTRFRERFEWRRGAPEADRPAAGDLGGALRSGGVAALLLILAAALLTPAPARASDVSRAADWLAAQQRPTGGFAADAGREAGAEMTSWAMLALAAAGRNPLDVASSGKSPVDFLRNHLDEVKDAGDVARTILALEASGVDPRSFAGENLVERLLAQRRQSGSYQGWPATSAYAVLALRSAGAGDSAAGTVEWLRQVQGRDGGWGNEPGDASTPEITGAVLQVLTPGSKASEDALAYLRKAKRPNGGFAPGNNLSANAQSTAWTSEGLLAAGKDPDTFGSGQSSFAYLRSLQADDGHFLIEPGRDSTPVWVTANAIIPLSGHFLPIAAPAREPRSKPKAAPETKPSAPSGGVPPSKAAPSSGESPTELLEKLGKHGVSGSGGSGSGGTASGTTAPSGKGGAGAKPPNGSSSGQLPKGSLGIAPATGSEGTIPGDATGEPASESTKGSSSTAGAILLGLLAGCLLFAISLAVRKGWMRWRYGL